MKKKTLALFSAAVMAAAAMTGCSNNTAPTSPSTEETTKAPEAPSTEAAAETAAEEQKKELVILGGNGAGLIAAIQAAEDGINPSKILILSGSGELAADMKEKEDFNQYRFIRQRYRNVHYDGQEKERSIWHGVF